MSLPLFTVLFPDGTTEYRTLALAPAVGDVVSHLGENLVIATIGNDLTDSTTVTLRHPDPSAETLL